MRPHCRLACSEQLKVRTTSLLPSGFTKEVKMVPSFMATMNFLLLCLFPLLSYALKFDITAESRPQERCIRNFVSTDTLVVVTATIGGNKGDGQRVDMHVR